MTDPDDKTCDVLKVILTSLGQIYFRLSKKSPEETRGKNKNNHKKNSFVQIGNVRFYDKL